MKVAFLIVAVWCVAILPKGTIASGRKGGPTLPPPPFVAHHMPSFAESVDSNGKSRGRKGLNNVDAFWRAGWQPVPMHSIGGDDEHRIPYLNKALEFIPLVTYGKDEAFRQEKDQSLVSASLTLTQYSTELPKGHKIFSVISPYVDDLPKRLERIADTQRADLEGAVDEIKFKSLLFTQPHMEANPNTKVEKWAGMCSASTEIDWCFISIGCWGSGNIGTQTKVAKAMDTVLEKYAGLDLFPSRQASKGDDNIRPCDIRFGLINGDNFYQSGISHTETTRLVTGFELIYASPTLLAMPWLVSLGNHDYRGDWFQQIPLTNRPVVDSWGHVGGAGPEDKEIGGWTTGMTLDTALTHSKLRPLRALDTKEKPQTFSTGRWYLPHPYYSARVAEELVMITLDCPLLERCKNNGNEHPRCWDKGAQMGWLRSVLETLDDDPLLKYRIIQCHYPLYANGPHVNHQWLIDDIEPLMIKHGVQMYINADNHYLQVSKKVVKIDNVVERASEDSEGQGENHLPRPYYFVNSGGGGGYGLNHHRTDKGYRTSPFSVFDEIRNGPMFHCLRDVGTPKERLVTMVYNDDAEKLFEFEVYPFVSPKAVRGSIGNGNSEDHHKTPSPFAPPPPVKNSLSADPSPQIDVSNEVNNGMGHGMHPGPSVSQPETGLHTVTLLCFLIGVFVIAIAWRRRRALVSTIVGRTASARIEKGR